MRVSCSFWVPLYFTVVSKHRSAKDALSISVDNFQVHIHVPPVCIMNMSSLLTCTQKSKSRQAYSKQYCDILCMCVLQKNYDSRVVFLHLELQHCRIEVDAVAIKQSTEMLQYQTIIGAEVLHEIHDKSLWLDGVHHLHGVCSHKRVPKNQTQTVANTKKSSTFDATGSHTHSKQTKNASVESHELQTTCHTIFDPNVEFLCV